MSNSRKDRLSLYIHFPFCRKKCNYCDFYSIEQISKIDTFIESLYQEISLYQKKISDSEIYTLYIGGGSPDLLSVANFNSIISHLKQFNDLKNLKEFTVEVNPCNISQELLHAFHCNGVNRISMGVQSFIEKELHTLGRSHTVSDVYNSIQLVKNAGINSLSLDLIFGIPGQTIDDWNYSINKILNTGAEHLSFYNLIYEPGTPLNIMKLKGKVEITDEDVEWQMYQVAHDILEKNNFDHYEISNWCKPEKMALHNSCYWNNGKYIGFGPAAHSFDKGKRWWNVRSVDDYVNNLTMGKSVVEDIEVQSKQTRISEMLMLNLRKSSGLDIKIIENITGLLFEKILENIEKRFSYNFCPKYGILEGDKLKLTVEGWFICDYIIQEIALIIDRQIENTKVR